MEDLEKKRTLLPADKVREKEAELQGKLQKVQQTYLRHQQDLQGKEQEATGKIFERMQRIIAKIASAENFTMIFDRTQAGLIFAKPHLDLTNEVIRRYNSGEGDEGGGPRPSRRPPSPPPRPRSEVAVRHGDGHPGDRGGASAPLSVPAGRLTSTSIDDDRIVARKLVSRNEPHFEGHFPGHPVMPGVLIVEALAQAGALFAARLTGVRSGQAGHLLHGHRRGEVPQAGGARRRARAWRWCRCARAGRSGRCAARPRWATPWSPRPSSWPASSRAPPPPRPRRVSGCARPRSPSPWRWPCCPQGAAAASGRGWSGATPPWWCARRPRRWPRA